MGRRSRKIRSEDKEKERKKLIREYVKRGYSANKIQKELQKRGLGMRRKELLAKVREVKGISKKPHAEKHVPIKYKRKVMKMRKIEEIKPISYPKWVAVYGTVNGKSRRVEMSGSGRELYNAMFDVVKHPPKRRFVRCHAGEAPFYLDYFDEWDEHPAVVS